MIKLLIFQLKGKLHKILEYDAKNCCQQLNAVSMLFNKITNLTVTKCLNNGLISTNNYFICEIDELISKYFGVFFSVWDNRRKLLPVTK